jgi:hypothetical protein
MLCLASVLLRRPYVIWTNDRRATKVAICLGLEVFTVGLRAYQICFKLYLFFLKVVQILAHHGGFPCQTEPWPCAPRLQEWLVCSKDGDVIQGSGIGLYG